MNRPVFFFLLFFSQLYSDTAFQVLNTEDPSSTLSGGSFRKAILDVNQFLGTPAQDNTITIFVSGTVSLNSLAPLIFNNRVGGKTIEITTFTDDLGAPLFTIDGGGQYRGLLVTPSLTGSETLQLTLNHINFLDTQDAGGDGAGGGASLGGALFVGTNSTVILNNVHFVGASATGGNGMGVFGQGGGGMSRGHGGDVGSSDLSAGGGGGIGGLGGSGSSLDTGGCGGGGGIGGSGGVSTTVSGTGAGGGGMPLTQGGVGSGEGGSGLGLELFHSSPLQSAGCQGGSGGGSNPGIGGIYYAASTPFHAPPRSGGLGGGGGGAAIPETFPGPFDTDSFASDGGFGGGGGGSDNGGEGDSATGGNGGWGGGGGGNNTDSLLTSNGGWGGGGGGNVATLTITSGICGGGFGGGGGRGFDVDGKVGLGGFAAGNGDGGAGSGLGGAIFVQDGGNLIVKSASFSGSSVAAGSHSGGAAGVSDGIDLYLHGSANATFDLSDDMTLTHLIGGNKLSVSSNGTFLKKGSADLTLASGAWPFDGPIHVDEGGLGFGGNLNLGTNVVSNSVTLNGGGLIPSLDFSRALTLGSSGGFLQCSSTIQYSGAMSGSGAFSKKGSGTLVIVNPQLYEGNTSILGGRLNVSADSGLGSLSGTLSLAASTTLQAGADLSLGISRNVILTGSASFDTNAHSMSIEGIIEESDGSHLLTKAGAGTLFLTGANTYTGGVTVAAGTLNINDNQALGSSLGPLSLAANTTLQAGADSIVLPDSRTITLTGSASFDTNTHSMSVEGVIGESGGSRLLTKSGAGTFFLTGANTYTGGVAVAAGILNINGNQALGNSLGPLSLAAGTTLQAGADSIVLPDSRTITLTGSASFDTNSYSMSIASPIGESGGSRSLTKTGEGTAFFLADNTYTGLTTAAQGTLSINGSIAASILVQSEARLQGTGRIGGNATIANGGALSPGNSIGALRIDGNLILNPSSQTQIEIGPGALTSLVDVGLAASLDGTLTVVPNAGAYTQGTVYTILTASNVTGSFSFTSPLGFNFALSYLPASVELTLVEMSIDTTDLFGNQLILANYFNGPAGAFLGASFTALAQLSGDSLKEALDTISPSRNSFALFAAQNTLLNLSDNAASHLASERFFSYRKIKEAFASYFLQNPEEEELLIAANYYTIRKAKASLPKKKSYDFWISPFGDIAHEKKSRQNPSFQMQTGGFLVGCDLIRSEQGLLGVAGGYALSSLHQADDFGKGGFEGGYLSCYGQSYFSQMYIETALWGGYQRIFNKRHIFFSSINSWAKSSCNSYQINPHLSLGYDQRWSDFILEPFATIDWIVNFEEGYQERGAATLNMKCKSHTSSMVRTETGVHLMGSLSFEEGALWIKARGSYVYKELFSTGKVGAAILGAPTSFTVEALADNQNLGLGSLELLWQSIRGGYFSLSYTGEFGSRYSSNQIAARLGKKF